MARLESQWSCRTRRHVHRERVFLLADCGVGGAKVEGEDESWDFGTGAGFYIDATESGWNENYKMYTYVTEELPELVSTEFPIDSSRMSITGHSMGTYGVFDPLIIGGHGALTLFLRNPGKYKSVSAFAPISNPMNCPWGAKVITPGKMRLLTKGFLRLFWNE